MNDFFSWLLTIKMDTITTIVTTVATISAAFAAWFSWASSKESNTAAKQSADAATAMLEKENLRDIDDILKRIVDMLLDEPSLESAQVINEARGYKLFNRIHEKQVPVIEKYFIYSSFIYDYVYKIYLHYKNQENCRLSVEKHIKHKPLEEWIKRHKYAWNVLGCFSDYDDNKKEFQGFSGSLDVSFPDDFRVFLLPYLGENEPYPFTFAVKATFIMSTDRWWGKEDMVTESIENAWEGPLAQAKINAQRLLNALLPSGYDFFYIIIYDINNLATFHLFSKNKDKITQIDSIDFKLPK